MSLGNYNGIALSIQAGGDVFVAGNASVDVREEATNTLAAIFADRAGATPLANPLTADEEGRFSFYAEPKPQGYKITATQEAAVLLAGDAGPTPRSVSYSLRNQQVELDATAYSMTVLDDADAQSARTTLVAQLAVITTKGDIAVGGTSGAVARKAVGANGSALIADSTQADGLAWLPGAATQADAIAYAIALG